MYNLGRVFPGSAARKQLSDLYDLCGYSSDGHPSNQAVQSYASRPRNLTNYYSLLSFFSTFQINIHSRQILFTIQHLYYYNKKIWSLAYADEIVLMAKSAAEMKEMIRRLEKYLDEKKMILSA